MKNTLFIITTTLTIIFSSCSRNDNLRNRIYFDDKTSNIQTSLLRIIPLLKKVSSPININKGYGYDGENLSVNNSLVTGQLIDTIKVLSKLNQNEKRDFVEIVRYLRTNEIYSGWFDDYLGVWLFEYRSIPEDDSSDVRVIAMLSKEDLDRNNLKIKILDKKDKIYLIKFR